MSAETDILAAKFKRSSDLLWYRRLNWQVETNHRIRWAFEAFVQETKTSDVPLAFSLRQHDTPNEGSIELRPERVLVGVVNRRLDPFSEDDSENDVIVVETGGELVASLSFNGRVCFIAHPRQSDRSKPRHKEILLTGLLDPASVTPALIRKVLKKYLLILRSTSILGMEDTISGFERIRIWLIYFADLRERNRILRSILGMSNEWAKVLSAIAGAFLVGYFTGGK